MMGFELDKRRDVNWPDIIYRPIIGYDKEFLAHCIEDDENKGKIIRLKKNNMKTKVAMVCDRGHVSKLSPYDFFVEKKRCLYCINENDKGAIRIDDTIAAYWDDDRFDVNIISEYSKEQYRFRCPFCGSVFFNAMERMVLRFPKCKFCNDGKTFVTDAMDESQIYVFSEIKRRKKRFKKA